MKKRNNFVALLGILLIVIGAGYYVYIQNAPKYANLNVVIARKDIESGTIITSSDVANIEMPKQYIVPNYIDNVGKVVGKMARNDIYAGEQVTEKALSSKEKGTSNDRMLAVKVTMDTVVGGKVSPNDTGDLRFKYDDKYAVQAGIIEKNILVKENIRITEVKDANNAVVGSLTTGQRQIPAYIIFVTDKDTAKKVYDLKDYGYFYFLKYVK